MTKGSKKIKLTRGAIKLLHTIVPQPNWAKTLDNVYRAGRFIEILEEKFPEDMPKGGDEQREWLNTFVEFDLASKYRKMLETCLEHHVRAGAIIPTKHTIVLMDALGIDFDDDEDENEG